MYAHPFSWRHVRAIGSREQYSTSESDSFCRTPPPKVAFFLRQCRFFYGLPAISFCCIIGRLVASTSQIDHVYPFQLVLSHVQGIIKESAPGRELPSSQQFELLLGYQFDLPFHLKYTPIFRRRANLHISWPVRGQNSEAKSRLNVL